MNALVLLVGLLVLSYIGSFLMSGRAVRGIGLPSGSEYVALGFILGPHVLGIVGRSLASTFEPIVQVALGWFALVIGLDFGFAGDRRVHWKSLVLALVSVVLTGGCIAAAVLGVLRRFPIVTNPRDAWLLAGGLGVACAETTRHAVQWVVERHRAEGKLSNLLTELSHADDLAPLLGLAVLFAFTNKVEHVPFHVDAWGWAGITIGLGLVLGAVAALLVGAEFHVHTTWGVLFGTSLLGIGTAARLGLSSLTVAFFMGVAMAAVSPHRHELREIVAPTERPVLLPALLLAGAHVDLEVLKTRWLALVVVAAILARVAGKFVSGVMLRGTRAARPASSLVGIGLLSSGALSVAVGLVLALRFPGVIGDTVLLAAAISAIFGEFVAPVSLRRVLVQAGDIVEEPSPASTDGAPAEER